MDVAAIFAKPPEPGRAKTRLIPLVGAERAAELAHAFLSDAWAHAHACDGMRAVISTTSVEPSRFGLSPEPELWDQGDGDLGARIERTLRRALDHGERAFAIGADAPDLGPQRIEAARAALDDADAVLVPADDGGFVLLGLTRCPEGLLADLPWSQPDTCARTVERLRGHGLRVVLLEPWFDVDEPHELRALAARLRKTPQSAPHTARLLQARPLPVAISVVLPVLDEQARIDAALQRLLAEPGIDEILVVDGGSRDDTVARAERHGVRVLLADTGRARQMNAGAAAATGEVLWFVHADVVLPHGAAAHVRHALRDPETVAGAFVTWTVNDSAPRPWAALLHVADLRSRVTRHPYGDQALFVRREVFESLGGFPDLALMEDVALAERLRKRGRIARIDARVQVSGRRFVRRPLRTMIAWNTLPFLYRRGVPTRWLARIYGHVR